MEAEDASLFIRLIIHSNEYPHSPFWLAIWKISEFLSEIFFIGFKGVKIR